MYCIDKVSKTSQGNAPKVMNTLFLLLAVNKSQPTSHPGLLSQTSSVTNLPNRFQGWPSPTNYNVSWQASQTSLRRSVYHTKEPGGLENTNYLLTFLLAWTALNTCNLLRTQDRLLGSSESVFYQEWGGEAFASIPKSVQYFNTTFCPLL